MTTCRYHCRTCAAHFTSLAAFDAHKPRKRSKGGCEWPEDAPLTELTGKCAIDDPDSPLLGVAIYEHFDAQDARDRLGPRKPLDAPPMTLIGGAGI